MAGARKGQAQRECFVIQLDETFYKIEGIEERAVAGAPKFGKIAEIFWQFVIYVAN